MDFIDNLKEILTLHADAQQALLMKKYLKDKFEFLGIKTPVRRELTKECLGQLNGADANDIRNLSRKLWKMPYREYQHVAIDMLMKIRKKVPAGYIDFYEWLIVNKSWWDTVDAVADGLAGSYFLKYPEFKIDYVNRWLDSNNMWLQRSAIIFQLKYRQKTDLEILEKCIHRCKGSNEFFIKKAIGWALRQYAKTDAEYVKKFISQNTLPSLSVREALKNL